MLLPVLLLVLLPQSSLDSLGLTDLCELLVSRFFSGCSILLVVLRLLLEAIMLLLLALEVLWLVLEVLLLLVIGIACRNWECLSH